MSALARLRIDRKVLDTILTTAAAILLASVIGAVLMAVSNEEVIAYRVGEPLESCPSFFGKGIEAGSKRRAL